MLTDLTGSSHSRCEILVIGEDAKKALLPARPRVCKGGTVIMKMELCPVQCSPDLSVPSVQRPGPLGQKMAFGKKSH